MTATLTQPAGAPREFGPREKLAFFFATYLCQNLPMGFVMAALPVILRKYGFSLERINFVYMLYLPWAFKWLYAARIDRHYSALLGRRRTWIVPLQLLYAALTALAAAFPPQTHLRELFAVLLCLSVAASTSDIAVDGYATDLFAPAERAWGNAAQVGGRLLGLLLGGGGGLVLFSRLEWGATLLTVSGATLLLALPAALTRERAPLPSAAATPAAPPPSALRFLRQKTCRVAVLVLAVSTPPLAALQIVCGAFLKDSGFTELSAGALLMFAGYPLGLAGVAAAALAAKRWEMGAALRWGLLVSSVLLGVCGYAYSENSRDFRLFCAIVGVSQLLLAWLGVFLHTIMMKFSANYQSGTNFSVLMGAYIIVPLCFMTLFSQIGDRMGFINLFLAAGLFSLAAALAVVKVTAYSEKVYAIAAAGGELR